MIPSPIQDGCSSSSDVTHECDQSMIFLESRLSKRWWEGRGRAKFTRYVIYSSKKGWRESFVLSWFIVVKGVHFYAKNCILASLFVCADKFSQKLNNARRNLIRCRKRTTAPFAAQPTSVLPFAWEQKHFPQLRTELFFHANSAKKLYSLVKQSLRLVTKLAPELQI